MPAGIGYGNSFLDAAKSFLGGKKKKKSSAKAPRMFDPKVREEIKDIRKGGGRRMLKDRQTRAGIDPEAGAAMSGGPLPNEMFRRARRGRTSIPR